VTLGPASTQIGLTSMVMLVVFAAQPLSPTAAAEQAGLILAGGLLQTLLAWIIHEHFCLISSATSSCIFILLGR